MDDENQDKPTGRQGNDWLAPKPPEEVGDRVLHGTALAGTLALINLDLLLPNPFVYDGETAMADEPTVERLEGSVERNGNFSLPLVRPSPTVPGKFDVATGHNRLRALRNLGATATECLVREMNNSQMVRAYLDENFARAQGSSRKSRQAVESACFAIAEAVLLLWLRLGQRSQGSREFGVTLPPWIKSEKALDSLAGKLRQGQLPGEIVVQAFFKAGGRAKSPLARDDIRKFLSEMNTSQRAINIWKLLLASFEQKTQGFADARDSSAKELEGLNRELAQGEDSDELQREIAAHEQTVIESEEQHSLHERALETLKQINRTRVASLHTTLEPKLPVDHRPEEAKTEYYVNSEFRTPHERRAIARLCGRAVRTLEEAYYVLHELFVVRQIVHWDGVVPKKFLDSYRNELERLASLVHSIDHYHQGGWSKVLERSDKDRAREAADEARDDRQLDLPLGLDAHEDALFEQEQALEWDEVEKAKAARAARARKSEEDLKDFATREAAARKLKDALKPTRAAAAAARERKEAAAALGDNDDDESIGL